MRLLIDTHVLLWALAAPERLGAEVSRMLDAADVMVSAASLWEISIKAALGKLDAQPREILEAVEPAGFSLLAVTAEHAVRVVELPLHHRDPFDRLLIAQALTEAMQLITFDDALVAYGSPVLRVPHAAT